MTTKEIEKLAKADHRLTKIDLDLKLSELKSKEWRIIECIYYVKINQDCSLPEATSFVVHSSAWIGEK